MAHTAQISINIWLTNPNVYGSLTQMSINLWLANSNVYKHKHMAR